MIQCLDSSEEVGQISAMRTTANKNDYIEQSITTAVKLDTVMIFTVFYGEPALT